MKLPLLSYSDGQAEALKWLALVSMTVDHVNKYLFHGASEWAFAFGRLAMPLFAVVLAFNLARALPDAHSTHWRVAGRLGAFAAVSSIPFIALGGLYWNWWPLNILFSLAIAVTCICLIEQGGWNSKFAAVVVGLIGGFFVEFWWPGIGICLSAWFYFKRGSVPALLIFLVCLGCLFFINGNHWALMALPVIFAGAKISISVPRFKYFFYAFYPAHLCLILLVKHALR